MPYAGLWVSVCVCVCACVCVCVFVCVCAPCAAGDWGPGVEERCKTADGSVTGRTRSSQAFLEEEGPMISSYTTVHYVCCAPSPVCCVCVSIT